MEKLKNSFEKASPIAPLICAILLSLISFVDLGIMLTSAGLFVLYKFYENLTLPKQYKTCAMWVVIAVVGLLILPCLLDIVAGIAELFGDGFDGLNGLLEKINVYGAYSAYAHTGTVASRALMMFTSFAKLFPWCGVAYTLVIVFLNSTEKHRKDKLLIKIRVVVLCFIGGLIHLINPITFYNGSSASVYTPDNMAFMTAIGTASHKGMDNGAFLPSIWRTFGDADDFGFYLLQVVGLFGLLILLLKVAIGFNKMWKENIQLCPYCFNEVKGGKKFCTKCGNKI